MIPALIQISVYRLSSFSTPFLRSTDCELHRVHTKSNSGALTLVDLPSTSKQLRAYLPVKQSVFVYQFTFELFFEYFEVSTFRILNPLLKRTNSKKGKVGIKLWTGKRESRLVGIEFQVTINETGVRCRELALHGRTLHGEYISSTRSLESTKCSLEMSHYPMAGCRKLVGLTSSEFAFQFGPLRNIQNIFRNRSARNWIRTSLVESLSSRLNGNRSAKQKSSLLYSFYYEPNFNYVGLIEKMGNLCKPLTQRLWAIAEIAMANCQSNRVILSILKLSFLNHLILILAFMHIPLGHDGLQATGRMRRFGVTWIWPLSI